MDKKKFIERIQNMLYNICGCNKEEAKEVLEECIKLNTQYKTSTEEEKCRLCGGECQDSPSTVKEKSK